jgi:hypothetical protein
VCMPITLWEGYLFRPATPALKTFRVRRCGQNNVRQSLKRQSGPRMYYCRLGIAFRSAMARSSIEVVTACEAVSTASFAASSHALTMSA